MSNPYVYIGRRLVDGTPNGSGAGAGFVLPAPQVKLAPAQGVTYQVGVGKPLAGGGALGSAHPNKALRITANNLPDAALDPALDLRLELVRYVRRGTIRNRLSGGGYVHPAQHGANNGPTHGGTSNIHPSLLTIRRSEWAVSAHGQTVNVTQGVLSYMNVVKVPFRNNMGSAGWNDQVEALVPVSRSNSNSYSGKRFAHRGHLYPGYFKFRYSIKQADGTRVTGPLSVTVVCSNAKFPLTPMPPISDYAQAVPNGAFDIKQVAFWLGENVAPR